MAILTGLKGSIALEGADGQDSPAIATINSGDGASTHFTQVLAIPDDKLRHFQRQVFARRGVLGIPSPAHPSLSFPIPPYPSLCPPIPQNRSSRNESTPNRSVSNVPPRTGLQWTANETLGSRPLRFGSLY